MLGYFHIVFLAVFTLINASLDNSIMLDYQYS